MANPDGEPTWRLLYGEAPQFVKPETRIYMSGIPSSLTEEKLTTKLRRVYGPVQIYCFMAGANDDGYAWVGFQNEESVRKVISSLPSSPQSSPSEKARKDTESEADSGDL
ncbi:hypothetical protein Efla_003253 [Eimeria flavescens]